MIYLFDTSVLLAHYRQETGWEQVQAIFADSETQIIIASVTVAEFARRMRELGASNPDIRQASTDYQTLFTEVVTVDAGIAWVAFDLGCRVPQRLPLVDALIAATAKVRSACLVHRDQHMAAIPAEIIEQ